MKIQTHSLLIQPLKNPPTLTGEDVDLLVILTHYQDKKNNMNFLKQGKGKKRIN